jgi:hypothetical protein
MLLSVALRNLPVVFAHMLSTHIMFVITLYGKSPPALSQSRPDMRNRMEIYGFRCADEPNIILSNIFPLLFATLKKPRLAVATLIRVNLPLAVARKKGVDLLDTNASCCDAVGVVS